MKILDFFLFLWVIFVLFDSDADPCGSGYGSGSETLILSFFFIGLYQGDGDSTVLEIPEDCGAYLQHPL